MLTELADVYQSAEKESEMLKSKYHTFAFYDMISDRLNSKVKQIGCALGIPLFYSTKAITQPWLPRSLPLFALVSFTLYLDNHHSRSITTKISCRSTLVFFFFLPYLSYTPLHMLVTHTDAALLGSRQH